MGGLFDEPKDYSEEFIAMNNNMTNLMQQMMSSQDNYNKVTQELYQNMEKDREQTNQLINNYQKMHSDMINTARKREEDEAKKKETIRLLKQKITEEVNEIVKNKIIEIENKIETIKKKWCEKELYQIIPNEEKLNTVFQSIIDYFQLEIECKEVIKSIGSKEKNSGQVNNFNIQIIGKTGVGKSTLVNALLQLSENEKAKEDLGECVTKETKEYENKNLYPGIKIYDTQGIELGENYNIQKMTENTVADIIKKLKQNIPSNLIHCLFYCIHGTRFEGIEKQAIIDIRNTYEGKKLPIIIIHTRATVANESEQLKQKINESLNERFNEQLSDEKNYISFVPILAKTEEKIQQKMNDYDLDEDLNRNNKTRPFGLDKLMKLSIDKAQFYIKFPCIMALKTVILDKITLYLTQINQNMMKSDFKSNTINNLGNENDLENFLMKIIEIIFNQYLNEFKRDNNENMIGNINLRIQCVRDFITGIVNDISNITRQNYIEFKKIEVEKEKYYLLNEQINKYNNLGIENGRVKLLNGEDIISLLNTDFDRLLEGLSTEYAIKNAASLFFDKISESFLNMLKNESGRKMENREGNLVNYFENLIGNKFSPEIINVINKLINDLERYQKQY